MSANDWLGVDLRHLAALEAVARTGSFGRAARELGYTQSAVSQQIAQLERIVGQQLFHRPGGPRPVEPTEAGLLLLRHADAIVAQLDAARADMAALAEGEAGTLRVGIYQSVGARLLPALVRRFRDEWPLVGVRVREESSADDLLRLLEHGELDLTFADLPLREGPFEWAELLQDPYVLLVSARSELATLDAAPPLRDVAKLPLIGRRSTDEPERFLAGRVPDVNVVFRTDDNGTLAPRRGGAGRRDRAAPRSRPARPRGEDAPVRLADPAAHARPRVAPRPLPLAGGARRSSSSRGGGEP
jgi:DNA-binding transcriptional LysR family regulator